MRTMQHEVSEVTLESSYRSTFSDIIIFAGTAFVVLAVLATAIR